VDKFFDHVGVIFTIHNLGYQGSFTKDWMSRLSLPWETFNPHGLEYYDHVNLMKAGIEYSDVITTVSGTYAKEIQSEKFGYGLDGVLRRRAGVLHGILNGIDHDEWNPEADRYIKAPFSADRLEGKAVNKAALQKRMGLPVRADAPLIGVVSRLAAQKGFDLISRIIPDLAADGIQFVLLGTGSPEYEERFQDFNRRFPDHVAARLDFDNPLAHQIEAGADMFLMPSWYEPCGLNQMYSMRYGTVPVVRKTGGLADTVINATPSAIRSGRATGFVFTSYTDKALLNAIRKASSLYRRSPDQWRQLQRNGMKRDFSWKQSALKYLNLYTDLRETR
jgi:starch synthase